MAKLIYSSIVSLDGYVADERGNFDWSEPDEEVHTFVNDLQRRVGTYLFGRRMYEVMRVWEDLDLAGHPEYLRDFARLWRDAEKVVYSSTLQEVSSARTRIARRFDPDAVARMKATASGDIAVAGPNLAAHAIRAGLVDEYHLFLTPMIVGGGTGFLPDQVRIPLALLDERRFDNGTVYVRYGVR